MAVFVWGTVPRRLKEAFFPLFFFFFYGDVMGIAINILSHPHPVTHPTLPCNLRIHTEYTNFAKQKRKQKKTNEVLSLSLVLRTVREFWTAFRFMMLSDAYEMAYIFNCFNAMWLTSSYVRYLIILKSVKGALLKKNDKDLLRIKKTSLLRYLHSWVRWSTL